VTWVIWNLVAIRLEMVLVSVQDWCTVCAKRNIGSEIVSNTHTMVLLGDEALLEAHFGPFGDSANLSKRGARFAPDIPWAQKSFLTHPVDLLGDVGHL
jgi:hypothetical protein